MKKLSFFLMAMLFSVMSFAKTEEISCAAGTIVNKSITFDFESMTVLHAQGTSTSEVKSYSPWRVYKNHVVTFTPATDVTIESLVITCSGSSYAANGTLSNATATLNGTTLTITPTDGTKAFTFAASEKQVRWSGIVVNYSVAGEVIAVEAPEFDVTTANFQEAFTLNITSAEGTTLKYTTDQTNPATSETAIEVATNTAAVQITKSTQVRAIAIKGSDVSEEKKMTYCLVNTPATAYTVAEAMAVIDAGLGLDNELYIKGTVSKVESYNANYGSITYWIEDEEGNDFECYSGLGLNKAKFTAKEDIEIGAYVVACGVMTKYNTIYEFEYNNYLVEYNAPAVEEPTIECKDALDFGAVAYNAEVAAQTLEVAGYNLTSDITVTLSEGAAFTVDQTTLSAEGGNLVVTPVSPLTVGTHTATLTLASGEATAEVTLTIVAKDVYTITWSVNGETTTTTVVEGDKLVLPAAPEAPEACSEKVFVGWTAAEEVNADGSEIEWVTATTAPTAAATYYAVFAAQEGEGGASEVVDVLNRALTGVEGTSYTDWTGVSATSTAVYAGQSAGSNDAIQLRSKNNNSGVISTTSGGKLAKVTVTWNSNTAADRTLDVYGSNTAYTAPTELYGDASGEKLGTIVCGTSTELVIDGDYAYVGLRSNSGAMYLDEIQITWIAGAAATYTDYSTTCEPEIPTVTLSCTDMDKMYMAMRDMLQLEGTSTNDEYVTVALYNYAATVGDYQASIAFGDLELETESLTINRGSEEWTLTATIDADTAIYEFTATTAAPKTETIAPRAATWGGDAMNGYIIDCTTTSGNVQISVMDGTEYGMGWMLNMAINDELLVEGATIDAPTWVEDNLVLDVTVVSGTLDEYTIQLTATPKPATEIIANATMALSEDEYEVGTMIVSATWEEHPLTVKLNGWPYYGYGEYAEANLIIEIDPENYDVVDAYSTATLEKKEDVAVLTGTFSDWNGNKYALTLTIAEPAAAPVVETVNVVCTDMVQGEEWGTPVLTGTCNLGDINISLYLDDTDHPESVYGEYGFAEYPMGLFPAVEVTIEGEDSFIMLELMENTVAVYTDGETQDSFVGTFLGSDWKVYVLDMKTPAPEGPSAVDNITTTVAPVKAIVNGQLVIVKDGVQYNAQGAVIK